MKPARLVWIIALLYGVWLGAHWLPLPMSDKELAASASRVWDVQTELRAGHGVPWWTPHFMSGSSYGLNHARGFYLLPWLLFTTFTDLITAGKLLALVAILASAIGMFYCARYFLAPRSGRSDAHPPVTDWAALFAALVFLFHPEQVIRAAGNEHLTVALALPFWPLLWLTFARALDTAKLRDALLCALTAAFAWWADNKQALIIFVFLLFYLLFFLWKQDWRPALRACVITGAAFLVLAAFPLVTGLTESKHVKLFAGDPLTEWQKSYAFKSLFALVDRDGVMTQQAVAGVQRHIQAQGGVRSQTELDQVRRVFSLPMDSPEKYAGLVVLALVAVAALFNRQRVNRRRFWFFLGLLLASIALAGGLSNLWNANWTTFGALFGLPGVPGTVQFAALLAIAVAVAGLILFAKRKLTSQRKWIIAGVILAAFLFVPAFQLIALVPYFNDIRAPFVFYDLPAAFLLAMLAGFFVTDVLTTRIPQWVAGLAVLVLLDYWPYQRPMKDNGVPARTIANLQAAYGSLRTDPDWVKTYSFSGRYFHLLGPMYSGKPQVYEAFYNWQSPLGTGLLNQHVSGPLFNLLGARYLVFDKTDPGANRALLDQLRQAFRVQTENEDFAVFRNNHAHDYLTAYRRAYWHPGDLRESVPTVLSLAARDWPVVHDPAGDLERNFPNRPGQRVPLTDVQLTRVNHGTIRIAATTPEPCLAVIAESYYPFWHATVNGQPAEVRRVCTGLMGLNLPAGTHQIELRYQPPRSYLLAAGLSLIGFVTVLTVVLIRHRS